MVSMEEFYQWLAEEIRYRGWSHSELARQAGISQALVSKVASGAMPPSCDFCIKLAAALNTEPVLVLRWAGILPAAAAVNNDPLITQVAEMLPALPDEQRRHVLSYVQFLYRQHASD